MNTGLIFASGDALWGFPGLKCLSNQLSWTWNLQGVSVLSRKLGFLKQGRTSAGALLWKL